MPAATSAWIVPAADVGSIAEIEKPVTPWDFNVSSSESCSVSLPLGGAKNVHLLLAMPSSEHPLRNPTWPAFQ